MKPPSPFRYFNSSPQVIRLVVMMYVRFPLSLRNVEDLLFERGIDLSYETVRFWMKFTSKSAERYITSGVQSTRRVKFSKAMSPRPVTRKQR
jgi:transposase-like protein